MKLGVQIKRISLFLLVGGTTWFNCLGQNVGDSYNKVSIASPSVGSLAKYVDIPVSLHTGIPQINIPLYTLTEGSLELPISLSYHASGLKTMEPAGWMGAGWSLNAGGMITRTVRGGPDEKGTINNFQTHGHFSDYGYNSYLVSSGNGESDNTPDGYQTLYENYFVGGQRDAEPDLFFFNFNGFSGKFYFNDDRTPMLLPEQDIKIEYNYPDTSESIQGFIITTPDGVKYYFGATSSTTDVDPVEFSRLLTLNNNGIGFDKVISSWYLNKIVSPDSQFTINLTYIADVYSYHMLAFQPGVENHRGYDVVKNFVRGVVLDNISTSNGQVNFILNSSPREDLSSTSIIDMADRPNTTAKALSQINIFNKPLGYVNKSFKFLFDYFTDNVTPLNTTDVTGIISDKKRLKLLSVQELNAAGAAIALPYNFEYFQEMVPRRLTFGQDHWGFNNGVTGNTKLVSSYIKNGVTVAGADREPAWPAMRGGTLNKITYPTGGSTTYEFGPNQFYISTSTTNGTRNQLTSFSVGMDGGSTTNAVSVYIDSKVHVFKFQNSDFGGNAIMNIKDANNIILDHVEASLNQSVEITRNYPAGTYVFEISKQPPLSGGKGAECVIYTLEGTVTNRNALVGGLRIQKITQNSVIGGPNVITSYDYNELADTLSSGVLYGKPAIVQVIRNDIWKDALTVPNSPNGCISTGTLSFLETPSSIRPLGSTHGSHIGYHKVKTIQQDNGYTVSLFDVTDRGAEQHDDIVYRSINTSGTACNLSIPNYPEAPLPFSFTRGDLLYEAVYNNSGQLISDQSYTSEYISNPLTTPAFTIVPNLNNPDNSSPLYTKYNLSTARLSKSTVQKRQFTGSDIINTKQETLYESAYHHRATKVIDYSSNDEAIETRYKYAPDFRILSQDNISDGYLDYLSAFNSCNTTFQTSLYQCADNTICRHRAFVLNDVCLSNARIDLVNYRRSNFTDPGNLYSTRFQEALNLADNQLKPILKLRQQNNISLIESSRWKNNRLINTTFNIYDHSPTANDSIYLTKIQAVDLVSPSISFTETSVANNSVVKDSRYTNKATFVYNQGNLVSTTPEGKSTDSYKWGYKNQLPIAKVTNAGVNEFYHENFEEASNFDFNVVQDSDTVHTGKLSGRIVNTGSHEIVSHSSQWKEVNLTTAKRFKYSGWIYSNGPSSQLYLFMKKLNETGYYTFVDHVINDETGKWVFIEKEFEVPADIFYLNLRLDNDGVGTVWYDDLKFHPAAAQMTTYTYAPLVGMTSQIDPKGQTSYYEYDSSLRLSLIRDQAGNILKSYCYNYAGQQSDCTSGSSPDPIVACTPISTLPCNAIQVSLPVNLTFNQAQANSIADNNNLGTGFTMVDAYSGTRLSVDGTPSNSGVPGYEASRLTLAGGRLQILSNKGISYLSNNNQINTLGIQFNSQNKYQVETVLINPFNGTSAQQAGIWIGQNDQTFLKLVAVGNKLEFRKEVNNVSSTSDMLVTAVISGLDAQTVYLRIVVDPATSTAEAFYSTDGMNYIKVGNTGLDISGMALTGSTAFAGIFATHRSSSTPVTYTFDNFSISAPAAQPAAPSISIALKCRTSGSCNDNSSCSVRYNMTFSDLDAAKTYTAEIHTVNSTTASVSPGNNFVQNGTIASDYLIYSESNGSGSVNFDLILYENGIEVKRQNFSISHGSQFAQVTTNCQ